MSNSMKTMRAVRGISQSLCIVLLLLTVRRAFSAEPTRIAFGILFWFTAPGPMVLAGKAFTTFLSRMATMSALSKSRRHPLKMTWPPPSASLLYKMDRAFLSLIAMGEP